MTLSKVKSICIILLAFLTIYQTGFLWFVNITNHNFLLNFFPFMHQVTVPDGVDRLVVPWRIIRSHGSGRFSAQYNNLSGERYGNIVLSHLLQNGRFVGTHPMSGLSNFLSYPAYIYEYAFPMEADWFTQGFNQRSTLLTARVTAPFRKVIIRPPVAGDSEAAVLFLCENGYIHEFAILPPEGFSYSITEESSVPYYIFEDFQFIRHGLVPFYGVQVSNPYTDDGSLLLDFVMGRVSGFFSNPAAILHSVGSDGDVWVYRDVNTVVRYYATNVLEYISYRAIDRSVASSFLNDYAAAVLFVERDTLVINDFYLADFREENGMHVFYFSYVVGDMPLIMAEGWSDQLSHPIIVTVDHGTVVRYRKIAFNFYIDERMPFSVNAEFRGASHAAANVILGYKISAQDINSLHWFLDGQAFPLQ